MVNRIAIVWKRLGVNISNFLIFQYNSYNGGHFHDCHMLWNCMKCANKYSLIYTYILQWKKNPRCCHYFLCFRSTNWNILKIGMKNVIDQTLYCAKMREFLRFHKILNEKEQLRIKIKTSNVKNTCLNTVCTCTSGKWRISAEKINLWSA